MVKIQNKLKISFGLLTLLGSLAITQETELDQWIRNTRPTIAKYLFDNISPWGTLPGTVVASPSRSYPNYYYHWVRDASLVMTVVIDEYLSNNQQQQKRAADIMKDYIGLTRHHQNLNNPSGGPGEPKFNVDGSIFDEPWGRPQNDGPALRAISMIKLANVMLNEGREDQVRALLWDGSFTSVIKMDLEFVSHHWQDTCFDLWEETKGHHFYTQIVQRRAMVEGSRLAKRLGDNAAAEWYEKQARNLEGALNRYWDAQKGYIVETLDRDGGADYKHSNLDTGVILGLLHGSVDSDGFMPFSDERVMRTAEAIERKFQEIYTINNKGHSGVAIGRYPEDRYTGVEVVTQADGGNPWFLTTLALAEYYYRLAKEVKTTGKNLRGFKQTGEDLVLSLRRHGDEFLNRARFHMGDNHMSEQINRQNGYMQGAYDLTWSYASFLTAISHR